MTDNFLKLLLDTKPQIQEAQKTPGRINTQEQQQLKLYLSISFSNYWKWKILHQKKILKESRREKNFIYTQAKKKVISDISETMQERREEGSI